MREILRKIKFFRLSKEEKYFINILNNITTYKSESNKECLYYKYNNKIVFQYDSMVNKFYVHSHEIWNSFTGDYNERSLFIKRVVEEQLNLKNINATWKIDSDRYWNEEKLKLIKS
jgi:hypothetical protein